MESQVLRSFAVGVPHIRVMAAGLVFAAFFGLHEGRRVPA